MNLTKIKEKLTLQNIKSFFTITKLLTLFCVLSTMWNSYSTVKYLSEGNFILSFIMFSVSTLMFWTLYNITVIPKDREILRQSRTLAVKEMENRVLARTMTDLNEENRRLIQEMQTHLDRDRERASEITEVDDFFPIDSEVDEETRRDRATRRHNAVIPPIDPGLTSRDLFYIPNPSTSFGWSGLDMSRGAARDTLPRHSTDRSRQLEEERYFHSLGLQSRQEPEEISINEDLLNIPPKISRRGQREIVSAEDW